MEAILIAILFLTLLFGTTTWLLFRDLLNKIEKTVTTTDFIFDTLIIENRKPEQSNKDRREESKKTDNTFKEWD
tara:strand:+ start:71 stop:292 length:222 start_codon:yes stop_codon:yes gene_type:complete